MGELHFVEGSLRAPETASTGETVNMSIKLANTDAAPWSHIPWKVLWTLATNPDLTEDVKKKKDEGTAWGWMDTDKSEISFKMPFANVWFKVALYRMPEEKLVWSSSVLPINNPEFWWIYRKFLGIPVWGWLTAGGAVATTIGGAKFAAE